MLSFLLHFLLRSVPVNRLEFGLEPSPQTHSIIDFGFCSTTTFPEDSIKKIRFLGLSCIHFPSSPHSNIWNQQTCGTFSRSSTLPTIRKICSQIQIPHAYLPCYVLGRNMNYYRLILHNHL